MTFSVSIALRFVYLAIKLRSAIFHSSERNAEVEWIAVPVSSVGNPGDVLSLH